MIVHSSKNPIVLNEGLFKKEPLKPIINDPKELKYRKDSLDKMISKIKQYIDDDYYKLSIDADKNVYEDAVGRKNAPIAQGWRYCIYSFINGYTNFADFDIKLKTVYNDVDKINSEFNKIRNILNSLSNNKIKYTLETDIVLGNKEEFESDLVNDDDYNELCIAIIKIRTV